MVYYLYQYKLMKKPL